MKAVCGPGAGVGWHLLQVGAEFKIAIWAADVGFGPSGIIDLMAMWCILGAKQCCTINWYSRCLEARLWLPLAFIEDFRDLRIDCSRVSMAYGDITCVGYHMEILRMWLFSARAGLRLGLPSSLMRRQRCCCTTGGSLGTLGDSGKQLGSKADRGIRVRQGQAAAYRSYMVLGLILMHWWRLELPVLCHFAICQKQTASNGTSEPAKPACGTCHEWCSQGKCWPASLEHKACSLST